MVTNEALATSEVVQAAGGVLWREQAGVVEVALVHRARYDDWSLPKGKARRHELAVLAAVREVAEETGAHVALSRRVGRVHYQVGGAPKVVRYWAMRYLGGDFVAGREVDGLRWQPIAAARERLSYDGDRAMLDAVGGVSLPTSLVILVRHARAGKRTRWKGSDLLRPLERVGRDQALALVPLISGFTPQRIISADPLRCLQTVQPLAVHLDLPIETDTAFGDASFTLDPARTQAHLQALIAGDEVAVVASQGVTIPQVVQGLAFTLGGPPTTAKGAAWVLGCRDGAVISADYYRAPAQLRQSR